MRKETHHKMGKFMSLLLAVVLICGMLPMQVSAAETDSDHVIMLEETETNDQIDAGGEGDVVSTKETLTGTEEPEEGCIVAFDPDDGKTGYNGFFKVTVPVGSKVTDKPADPTRDGYLFKGWYGCLDENGSPAFWDFETDTVQHNTTLWAAWEEGYTIFFELNDGNDTLHCIETVPASAPLIPKPADPEREGYIFLSWYGYVDENNDPVLWDFETDTAPGNMILSAAWEKETVGGGENNGGGNGNGGSGGNNSGGSGNGGNSGNNSGGSGSGSGSGGNNSGGNIDGENGSIGNGGGDDYIVANDEKTPAGPLDLDDIPKTGDSGSWDLLLWLLCGISVSGMITLTLPRKKKAAI